MKQKKALKHALPALMLATLFGATTSWYLATRKRSAQPTDVDFQTISV